MINKILFFFIIAISLQANTYQAYLDKATEVGQKEHVYKSLPWVDLAIENANGSMKPYSYKARLELLLALSNGKFIPDMIFLCNTLKKKGIDVSSLLPDESAIKTVEDNACNLISTLSGKGLFSYGLQIANRTNSDLGGMKRALPYFELAERKGYKSDELFESMGVIYYATGNYSKAIKSISKYSKLNKHAILLNFLGKSQLLLAKNDSQIQTGIRNIEKSASLGNKDASKLLAKINEIKSSSKAGLKRESWADSEHWNNLNTYGYSCNGEMFTVSVSDWYLSASGLGSCYLSSTTHSDTIESLAKKACNCYK